MGIPRCGWSLCCVRLCDFMNCSPPGSSVHSRQEYWSGLPCPPPWDLPNPGITPRSATLQVDSMSSKSLFKCYLTRGAFPGHLSSLHGLPPPTPILLPLPAFSPTGLTPYDIVNIFSHILFILCVSLQEWSSVRELLLYIQHLKQWQIQNRFSRSIH